MLCMKIVFNKNSIFVVIVSLFMMLSIFIGYNLKSYGDFHLIIEHKYYYLMLMFTIWILLFLILNYLYLLIDKVNLRNSIPLSKYSDDNIVKFWTIIYFIIYTIYFIWLFPGQVSYDCITMLVHFFKIDANGIDNTSNPAFQTLLLCIPVYICKLLGNERIGIVIYTIIQCGISIFTYMYVLRVLLKYSINRYIVNIVALIWLINPIYPMYASSINKDSLFSSFMLLYVVLLFEMCTNQEKFFIGFKRILSISIVSLMVALLRNGTIYMVVLMFAICFLYLHRKYRIKWVKYQIPILLIAYIFLLAAQRVYGEIPKAYEGLSVYYQQTARYTTYYSNEQSEDEIIAIKRVIDYDNIKEKYSPEWAEPMMVLANHNINRDDISAYKKVWWLEFKRHPFCCITATLANSYAYFYPAATFCNTFTYNESSSYERVESFLDLEFNNRSDIMFFQNRLRAIPFIGLISTCGFYAFLFLFSVGKICHNRAICVALLPELICFAACLFLPANGNFRYALSIVYTVPLYLGLCWYKERC